MTDHTITDNVLPEHDSPESAGSPYQVVARRYRPQGFSELVGQSHVAQALTNAIQTGRIGHAYLFTGARGVGKTSSARIFAKALNCEHGPTVTPCNECEICQSVSTGEDVDVIEIDGASNRGIDEIRQLRQNASVKPSRARFKIHIIDEVHMLTREAFNALLKTLEEPPTHVKFIFCTTEPSKIPITILSRCQRFDFAGIDPLSISRRLAEIADKEGVTAEEGVFETLARRASGSMRDAQSLLEQLLSFAPKHIAQTDVHGMLGTADDQRLFRIVHSVLNENPAEIFTELDAASQEGVDFGVFVEQLMGLFRDLMVSAGGGDKNLLMYSSPSRYEDVKKLARDLELPRILASLQILDQTYTKMRYSTQGRILLELALGRICQLPQLKSIATLLDQIRSGSLVIPASPPSPAASVNPASANPVPINPVPAASQVPAFRSAPPQKKTSELNHVPEKITPEPLPPASVMELSEAELPRIWSEMANKLPVMAASQATMAKAFRLEPPSTVIAVFPSDQSFAKSYCENEAAKIQTKLRDLTGTTVQLRFETIEVKSEEKPAPPVKNSMSGPVQKMRMLAEMSDHPLIQKAAELFGANLSDIKSDKR
ncbi:MAG: DNA polymerase III subunit gamma/tau [Planctomycetaceae bacterium]|jgi:DNA polymerase-3 subunit gamma/tau|nr:DNA polymerase III subunit gamma/tau [Planctomycetaceae bacterium]